MPRNRSIRAVLPLLALLIACLGTAPASSADIKVMISAGFFNVYRELGPAFEKSTGHKLLTTLWGTPAAMMTCAGGFYFHGDKAWLNDRIFCVDTEAARRLPMGRVAQYASASRAVTSSMRPLMHTCFPISCQ